MNRPVFYVDQKEDPEKGTFWWTVSTANGTTILASEMYTRRSDARKAARRFIGELCIPTSSPEDHNQSPSNAPSKP
ncbi:DUF1508 domain-containing protein [Mycobacterium phage mcgavigan]|nr:hypothetical protein SEA_OGOPOGO_74 [Mycobacterium phage Ogopogo]WRQ08566.1 DUF1508 domain-containing protein [Mycobacterium phage mcgavigan]